MNWEKSLPRFLLMPSMTCHNTTEFIDMDLTLEEYQDKDFKDNHKFIQFLDKLYHLQI